MFFSIPKNPHLVLYFIFAEFTLINSKALYWEGYVHTACPLNKMFNNILNEAQLYLTSCSLWRRNNARSSAVKYCKYCEIRAVIDQTPIPALV